MSTSCITSIEWNYDWIDIPGMLRGAAGVFQYR